MPSFATFSRVRTNALWTAAVLALALAAGCERQSPSSKLAQTGYVELMYEVDIGQGQMTTDRIIEVLRKTVDPKGEHGLVWEASGPQRITVRMPLPSLQRRQLRAAYVAARDALAAQCLSREKVEQALQRTANRAERLKELAADDPERARLLDAAAEAFDTWKPARDADRSDDLPPNVVDANGKPVELPPEYFEEVAELRGARIEAESKLENAIDAVLATSLMIDTFERTLQMAPLSRFRKRALTDWQTRFPQLQANLQAATAAYETWNSGRQFLEDSEDLKRLLRGRGRLDFRILPTPNPAQQALFDQLRSEFKQFERRILAEEQHLRWFLIDDPASFLNCDSPAELAKIDLRAHAWYILEKCKDDYYVLAKTGPQDSLVSDQGDWAVKRARPDRDENGRMSVSFELDSVGGARFYTLTANNIGQPLCILLDDVAYTAPNIQSAIRSAGQITGDFSTEKIRYMVQCIEGGALPCRLRCISDAVVLPAGEQ